MTETKTAPRDRDPAGPGILETGTVTITADRIMVDGFEYNYGHAEMTGCRGAVRFGVVWALVKLAEYLEKDITGPWPKISASMSGAIGAGPCDANLVDAGTVVLFDTCCGEFTVNRFGNHGKVHPKHCPWCGSRMKIPDLVED